MTAPSEDLRSGNLEERPAADSAAARDATGLPELDAEYDDEDLTLFSDPNARGARVPARVVVQRPCADLSLEIDLPRWANSASLLAGLVAHRVRFVVIGGLAEALAGAVAVDVAGVGPRERPVLEICYAPTTANMRRLATALRALGSGSLRENIGLSGPLALDLVTLRCTTALALATSLGAIYLRQDVPGVGGFDDVRGRSTRVRTFGLEVAVLDLSALTEVRAACGGRDDIGQLPMLETLFALPALAARRARSR